MKRLLIDKDMGRLLAKTIVAEVNVSLGDPGELLVDAASPAGVVLVGDYLSSTSVFELYRRKKLPHKLSRWYSACDECMAGPRNDAASAERFMKRYPGTNLEVGVTISMVAPGCALNVSGEHEYRIVLDATGHASPNAKATELARRRRILVTDDAKWSTTTLRYAVTVMAIGLLD